MGRHVSRPPAATAPCRDGATTPTITPTARLSVERASERGTRHSGSDQQGGPWWPKYRDGLIRTQGECARVKSERIEGVVRDVIF